MRTNTKVLLIMSKRVHFVVSRAPKSNKGESRGGRKQNGSKSKKRPWDATVSDLSVHKLTRDELERRHKSHQSKNTDIAKHELYEKAKENLDLDSSGNLRPSPLARGSGQKFAALQRSLQGKELHQVLAESDRALRVVKDMFGDDPMRYTCQPNVTVAPHIVSDKANLERTLMESQRDGPSPTAFASPGGIRDVSILELAPSKPALNELPTPTELIYEESGPTEDPTLTPGSPDPSITPQGRGYKSSLDLKRFQALIQREELVDPESTNPGVSVDPPPYRRPLNDRTQKVETSSNSSENNQQAVGKGPSKQESGRRMNEMQSSTTSDRTSRHTLHVHVPSAGPTHTQVTAQHDDSVTGLSDISSIPAHTDGGSGRLETDAGGGVTVESDNSLIYSKDAAPLTRPVLSAHPLHVAHKMTPLKRQETTEKIHSELQDLEKLVRGLDRELQDYEQTTSYTSPSTVPPTLTFEPSSHPDSGPAHTVRVHTPTSGTLGSITSSLLSSVTKMTHYLRESEAQLKGEMEVRGHLIQTMTEQQNLMDALTTDVVKLQKENVLLRKEIQKAKHNTSEQLLTMQREISDLHKKLSTLVVHPPPQPTPVWSLQPLHHGTVPSATSLQSLQTPVQTMELPSSLSTPERLPEQLQELNSHPQQYEVISTSLALPSSSSGASTHVQSQGGTLTGSSSGCIYPGSISVHNPSHTNPAVMSTRSPITSHVSGFGPNSSGSQSGLTYIYAQQSPLGYNHGTSTVTPSADSHSAQLTSGVKSVNNPRTKEDSVELTPQDSPYIRDPLPSQSQALSTTSSATIPTPFNDTFAPSPPPLSIALQVPGESRTGMTTNKLMRVGTSKHSTATSLFSGVSSERNGLTEPIFDVTSFLNSLGKLGTTESGDKSTSEISSTPQPSLAFPSQTEAVIKQMSTFPTPNSTNITSSTSEKPTLNGKLPNGTTALTTSRGKLSTTGSEQSMSRKPLHAPDLSISLLSSLPEQTESSQTASETSLDSRPEHPLVYESKVFQNGTLKQSSSGTKLAHKESVVDSPPGWFALTSHLSHQ